MFLFCCWINKNFLIIYQMYHFLTGGPVNSYSSVYAFVRLKPVLFGISTSDFLKFGIIRVSQNKKKSVLRKNGQGQPKMFFILYFFKKIVIFPVNNLKWKIIMLVIVIFHCKPLIWQNSASQVMGRNTMDRSDYMFFKS